MINSKRVHVVVDTNVVFEGLTKQGSASGFIIEAWLDGLIQVHVSTPLAYEYKDVLGRKLSPPVWAKAEVALRTLLSLVQQTTVHYSWRPTSPDPNDDLVIDCAMNANAAVVTLNLKDFRTAQADLGLTVLTPAQLIEHLAQERRT
jgi:putative PIN family toxin of toxin-antitoxin system